MPRPTFSLTLSLDIPKQDGTTHSVYRTRTLSASWELVEGRTDKLVPAHLDDILKAIEDAVVNGCLDAFDKNSVRTAVRSILKEAVAHENASRNPQVQREAVRADELLEGNQEGEGPQDPPVSEELEGREALAVDPGRSSTSESECG